MDTSQPVRLHPTAPESGISPTDRGMSQCHVSTGRISVFIVPACVTVLDIGISLHCLVISAVGWVRMELTLSWAAWTVGHDTV